MPTADSLSPGDATPQVSLIGIANVLLRQRRLILVLTLVAWVAVETVTIALPRKYSSIGSFLPNSNEGLPSSAAGLAAQFGVILPGGVVGQSPQFYAELIRSREILLDLVDTVYEFGAVEGFPFFRDSIRVHGNLVEVFDIRERTLGRAREKAMQVLEDLVEVSTGRLSGTIAVRVSTKWPSLSQAIARRTLELVDEFNRNRSQSQAAAERQFIDTRLVTARSELRDAENALQVFLQRNRTFQNSPQLLFEHDRLQREVVMRQQIYTSLSQALEQARIEEVRNTPVITVIQDGDFPELADRRHLIFKGLIALVVGALMGVIGGFFREMVRASEDEDADSFAEFERLKRQFSADLRRPWRLLWASRV